MEPKTIHALTWILGILNDKKIPYQLSGGFSAKLYGSKRILNDIDIDIPDEFLRVVQEEVRPYIVHDLGRYQDGKWDLELMTLDYYGQEIDIGGGSTIKVTNKERTEWIPIPANFSNLHTHKIGDLEVFTIAPEDLISYKSHLDGDHQQVDIDAAKEYIANHIGTV